MSAPSYGPDLTIPHRFRGPARSGNGGYTAGVLAERLTARGAVVEVTLRQPPPLDVPMQVRHLGADDPANMYDAETRVLLMGGAKIAEARVVDRPLETVDAVRHEQATAAEQGYAGARSHPFPSCFACGTDRAEGDGLRIFPGPIDQAADSPPDQRLVAAGWVPTASLAELSDVVDENERVGLGSAWAALDCVGGWAGGMEGRKMVLGQMTAQVDALPVVGEPHVVVGRMLSTEGRKTFTASTLYDSDERIVARAQHVWIAIDPSAFS